MFKITKSLFLILFLATFSIQVNSETSWIVKKDGNKKKIVKETKSESSNWIKKKEVKENKKKLKEKIKESKSWITKKSKEKVKDIKVKLKKHKDIDKLPKSELYLHQLYIQRKTRILSIFMVISIQIRNQKNLKNLNSIIENFIPIAMV